MTWSALLSVCLLLLCRNELNFIIRLSPEHAVPLFWMDHAEWCSGKATLLQPTCRCFITSCSGNWMLPLVFISVWSSMFRSHTVLHFSIFQMHLIKFNEYIPLLKSQPYDNNLLFSSCIMRALASWHRWHCEFGESLKDGKWEGKEESISHTSVLDQITLSAGFLPAASVSPYLYGSSQG